MICLLAALAMAGCTLTLLLTGGERVKCSWFSQEGLTAALPPNVEAGRMAGIIRGTLLGAVFGGGILFACRYGSAYQSLMEWDPVRNRSVVRAGARMLPFWQTMDLRWC